MVNKNVDITDLDFNNTAVTFTSLGLDGTTDVNAVSHVTLTYPRTFDFNNDKYTEFILGNNQAKYIEISNFDAGGLPVLYDITNSWRLFPIYEDGVYKVMLPAGPGGTTQRKLIMLNVTDDCTLGNCSFPCDPDDCGLWSVPQISPINFFIIQGCQPSNYYGK